MLVSLTCHLIMEIDWHAGVLDELTASDRVLCGNLIRIYTQWPS